MRRFLIKKVFDLFLSFNRNVVNGSFTLDGSIVQSNKTNYEPYNNSLSKKIKKFLSAMIFFTAGIFFE